MLSGDNGILTKSTDAKKMTEIAEAKEQEQLFSHTRLNGTEWYTVDSSCCYGECLSRGYNEHEVTTAWMNSPTHKAVIMDGSYKTAGIGYYTNNEICYIALETGY